ncbi:MAG: hypothetical protein JXX14_19235 [Deltaproteobacteria bacterium]|nr:hypothetical protein [Deltaproteobacteria bacterium]
MANKPYSRIGYTSTDYRSVTYKPAEYTPSNYAGTDYTGIDADLGADAKDNLMGKINLKDAQVAVLGLENGGLALAVAFAQAGFVTTGIVPSAEALEMLSSRHSPVADVSDRMLTCAMDAGLTFCEHCDGLACVDCILISLSPSDPSQLEPEQDAISSIVHQMRSLLKSETLIILETGAFPGMTAELVAANIYNSVGLKTGQDVFVAFSARPDKKNPLPDDPRRMPKTVGGVTPLCTELADTLYRRVFDRVKTDSIIPAPGTTEGSPP